MEVANFTIGHVGNEEFTPVELFNELTENLHLLDYLTNECPYRFYKILILIASLLVNITIGTGANFGIIWYENLITESRRTLVNKMISVSALCSMIHVLCGSVVNATKIFTGSKNELFCDLYYLACYVPLCSIILVLNEIVMLRCLYAYFCSVGILDEGLMRLFLIIHNVALCMVVAIALMVFRLHRKTTLYGYCIGAHPAFWSRLATFHLLFPHLLLLIVIHGGAYIFIKIYKRSRHQRTDASVTYS